MDDSIDLEKKKKGKCLKKCLQIFFAVATNIGNAQSCTGKMGSVKFEK